MNFRKNQSYRSVYLGLQGELYDTNSKAFAYYNPFSTSALTCSMRVCSEPLGEGTAATYPLAGDYPKQQWVGDAIVLIDIWHFYTSYTQIDFLASGDVLNCLLERRDGFWHGVSKTKQDVDRADDENSCNYWINACAYDYVAEREVMSAFFEFAYHC